MRQILFFMKQLHRLQGSVIYLNQVGMALMSLLEGVSIFLLIPLINLTGFFQVKGTSSYNFSFLTKEFHFFSPTINLVIILFIYVSLMILQSLFQKYQLVKNSKIEQKFIRVLKEETYKSILESNWNFFIQKRKSDLVNVMLVEISRVAAGTNSFLQFISTLVFSMIQVGVAFYISAKMTIFILICGGILLLFSRTFIRKSNSLGYETFELSRSYLAGVTDQLSGMKDIKSNILEKSYLNWFTDVSRKIEKNIIEIMRIKMSSQNVYKITSSILIAVFLFFSIQLFHDQSANLMLILVIFSRLWPKVTSVQSSLEEVSSNLPAFNALIDLQKECEVYREFSSGMHFDEVDAIKLEKSLECKGVYFGYDINESGYALKDINLIIPANQMSAIVGRSGAGKSTLIDLLMGLNRPQKGEIFIDGEQINDLNLLGLRKSISYVPQEPFLFNTSIRDNLKVVKPNVTDNELWEALQFAAAADFVNKLPQKLETVIGDRGIKLSGGERQRLVLARAILKNPSILILDEATSSLDTENETTIQEAIERIRGKMTIIVIAHRLSTIRNADQVIVLDEGKVVQQGGYGQLAHDKRGIFGQLLAKQLKTIP